MSRGRFPAGSSPATFIGQRVVRGDGIVGELVRLNYGRSAEFTPTATVRWSDGRYSTLLEADYRAAPRDVENTVQLRLRWHAGSVCVHRWHTEELADAPQCPSCGDLIDD